MLHFGALALFGLFHATADCAATPDDSYHSAARISFNNRQRLLFDSGGNQIDAYGSKINFFNGSYYLYGNSFSAIGTPFGIKSYSSNDLEHWNYEGFLFDPYAPNPCDDLGYCGRPHILQKDDEYILWANAGSDGYLVATSASPAGPFTFLADRARIDPQFDGLQPADFSLEIIDGKGYIVFSALNFQDPRAGNIWPPIFQTLHISELTSDYTNTTGVSYPVTSEAHDLIDQETESPDIFVRNGTYYIAASNTCSYCNGSIGLLYRSSSIEGPWIRQIVSDYSCNGQVEGVLPLTDPHTGQVSYVWHSTSVPGGPRTAFGGHIFQPLRFREDGSVDPLNCSANAEFTVGFTRGSHSVTTGLVADAVDKTPSKAVYTPVCDSDQFDLFQTWRASGGGRLKSVSVNVARASQSIPLALTVFKFSSYADLLSPQYKWTQLGTTSVNATSLGYSFDTATIQVTSNVTVNAGDLLGLSIAGADFAPYCHLEYDLCGTDEDKGLVLYQRGAGQNSWRGFRGNIAPVYERTGKSVKFFTTYEQ